MTDHQTAQRLLAMEDVLILTHRRPDGDTIGCACALCLALRQLGKTAWVLPNEDAHGLFTPYFEGVLAPAEFVPQFVVSVDTAALGMLPGSGKAYADRIDLAIDHHGSHGFFAPNVCLDADAAACGESDQVARAIADHYRPRFSGDAIPTDIIGQVVALSDKIDTICGLFAVGQAPTGSSDPFALRRAALGVLAILEETGLPISLVETIDGSLIIYR